ncbi:MAG: hypothetical protein IJ228_04820 [Succinivibrio sp.]|nr:hypothetical protein [Succinivibrio sp.]
MEVTGAAGAFCNPGFYALWFKPQNRHRANYRTNYRTDYKTTYRSGSEFELVAGAGREFLPGFRLWLEPGVEVGLELACKVKWSSYSLTSHLSTTRICTRVHPSAISQA